MPQSNQRGIETPTTGTEGHSPIPGLNRTSVGLKHQPTTLGVPNPWGPQSNQRGIETELIQLFAEPAESPPQSNQRGIETGTRLGSGEPQWPRLNRTSVGLKRQDPAMDGRFLVSLNRTSVGLKLLSEDCIMLIGEEASIEPAWD